jgi:uncharacterized membrane protein
MSWFKWRLLQMGKTYLITLGFLNMHYNFPTQEYATGQFGIGPLPIACGWMRLLTLYSIFYFCLST